MFHCEICDRVISVSRYRRFRYCYRQPCRATWYRQFWMRVRKGTLEGPFDMQRAAELLGPAAERLVDRDPHARGAVVVVPDNSRRIATLPEKRKRAFRHHVMTRISEAAAEQAARPSEDTVKVANVSDASAAADPLTVLQNACATCQGRCCWPGQNSALLTTNTIRRFMREHPHLRPRDVLAAYLERLPSKTYVASCVFHTPQGCALPRQMRSYTCNTFMCSNLVEIQQQVKSSQHRDWLIIAAQGTSPSRATRVHSGSDPPVKRVNGDNGGG